MIRPIPPRAARRGAAVVELAVILPLLVFLFLVVVDYCRLFYFSQVVTGCARLRQTSLAVSPASVGKSTTTKPANQTASATASVETRTRGSRGATAIAGASTRSRTGAGRLGSSATAHNASAKG